MKGKARQIKAFGGKNTNLSTNNRKMKRALKKGVLATVAAPNSFIFVPHPACLGRCTLLKWRLRRKKLDKL